METVTNQRPDDVPLHEHIGVAVEHGWDGTSRVTLPLTEAVRGFVVPIHGGILATLSDIACASAIGGYDGADAIPVSVELNVRFFGQPRSSPLVAHGEVVHRGSRVIGTECRILDGGGRQIARATGTYMIVRGFGALGTDLPPQATERRADSRD